LEGYADSNDYRDAEKGQLSDAISSGKLEINNCTVIGDVATALQNAKDSIDDIKPDAEYVAEELAAAKVAANAELDTYKNAGDYRDAQKTELADAISAGRPGARRDTLEIYIKRLQKIEEIVNGYEGIKQSFAVQAGREVRVIVESDMFDDLASQKLARDVAKRIEDELDYPGQIRVTVVREFRTVEIAK